MNTQSLPVPALRGIDERWNAEPQFARRARDLSWNGVDAWEDAGGYRRLRVGSEGNPYTGRGKIQFLTWFAQRTGGKQFLLYETDDGALWMYNGSDRTTCRTQLRYRDGTLVADRTVLTVPWAGTQSACWGDRIYLVNGFNRAAVFDGYTVDEAGFSQFPPTPTVNVSGSNVGTSAATSLVNATGNHLGSVGVGPVSTVAGTNFDCGYKYRVSFVNERGQESPPSAPSEILTFTNYGGVAPGTPQPGSKVVWLDLPIGPVQTVARRIYRTQNMKDSNGNFIIGAGDVYYYVGEVRDNITNGFEDYLSDSSLGSVLDELQFGLFPREARLVASFRGRLYVATSGGTTLYFSRRGYPEVFPPDNAIDLGDAHLGTISALYPTRDALVLFKERGIYIVKEDSSGNPYAITLNRKIGTGSPNAIKEIPGVGLCFLSGQEVYVLQGTLASESEATVIERLSTPLPDTMKRLNRSAVIAACCEVYHRAKEVWWAVPTLGSDTNNLVLAFHYEVGSWTTRENFPISRLVETQDHRGYLVFGSYDDTAHPGIHVYSRGWDDKDGTTIQPLYQTAHVAAAGIWRLAFPVEVMLRCGSQGNNTITMNVAYNRKVVNALSSANATTMALQQQAPQAPFPRYGNATYNTTGTYRWSKPRPVTLRWPVPEAQTEGGIVDVSFTFAPSIRHLTLQAVDVEFAPRGGDEKPPAPASDARTR